MTPPSSCTLSIMPCVSSADVLSSAPISIAPRPSSVVARAVRSVPSSMPCKPEMTLENRSSVDMLDTSSMLKPIASNAATWSFDASCDAVASFLNVADIEFMLVPEC